MGLGFVFVGVYNKNNDILTLLRISRIGGFVMDENKISEEFIKVLLSNMKQDPFEMMTVNDVAKDLGMGVNTVNSIFKRDDFPTINLGKRKIVTRLAYYLWKMKRRD